MANLNGFNATEVEPTGSFEPIPAGKYLAEQVEAGLIEAEAAEHHPFRHILTRCLGAEKDVEAEVYPPRMLQFGDVLVLCSDGLTEHVHRREVASLIASLDPSEVAQALVEKANERGGHDNITVVVARVT